MKLKLNIGTAVCLTVLCLATAAGAAQDQVFELGEIVVTGDRAAANLATTVTEVTMEEIQAKGATTVAEALEFLPGVYVHNGGKGEQQVNIRGFEQRQVKILIDGVPARENYFGTVDLSMLPADSISKITITKGASSVLYGPNTMGGVINIITKKGTKTPSSSISAAFGDYDTARYSASHSGRKGPINYWLSAGYQTSDGFRLSGDFDPNDPVTGLGTQFNEDGGKRDLSDYEKKNLNLKVGYEGEEDSSLYLSFNHVDNDRGIPTFYSRYWAYDTWKQSQLNLTGETRVAEMAKVKGRLFYVKHKDGITDVSWDDDHTTGGKKWFEQSYYDDDSMGGELQTTLNLASWNTLRLGISYMEDNHREGNYLDASCADVISGSAAVGWQAEQEYTADTYTLGIEDEIRPMARLSLVGGVSYDVFEPTQTSGQPAPGQMDIFNPQAGAVYDITDATSLHASVGQKTRFPSLRELYSTLIGGNPDLNPEKTLAYEVGVTHTFVEKIQGELSFFYNDIDDLITTTRIDGNTAFININKAVIRGVEAKLSLPLSKAADLGLNYTGLSTEDKSNNGRDLEGRPRHRLNLDLGYRFPFGLRANLQASYNRHQYWNDAVNDLWVEVPDYVLVNAKLTQTLKKVGEVEPELFVQGTNILDQDYYETNGAEPGLNFLAGITLRF